MKSQVLVRLATITMFATLSSMGMGAELAFVPAGASSAGGISGDCVVLQPPSIHQLPDQGGTLGPNLKSRFLAVVLNDPGREVAIEVEFVDLAPPYDLWNGYRMYARAPIQICEENTVTIGPCAEDTYATAKLECTSAPVFADFESLGAVNLSHEGIVPESSYSVRVIDSTCDTTLDANFSASTSIQTARLGDVGHFQGYEYPVDDRKEILDILGGIAAFSNAVGKPSKSRTETASRCINNTADIDDVLALVLGFKGGRHPFKPSSSDACASNCPDP